jgi:hypothetical protein
MPKLRFTKRLIVLLAAAATLIFAAWIFFFGETEFSLSQISWHRNFNQAMEKNNEVKLRDLVDFKWEKIYFLGPYDFLSPQETAELFPGENLEPYHYGLTKHWMIAYQRPNKPPFLINISISEWQPRNGTNLWTTDPDATLRRVQKGTVEFTWCSPKYDPDRCLALDDERSKAPTVKSH